MSIEYKEMVKFKMLGIDITECKIIELGRGGTRYIKMDDLLKQIYDNLKKDKINKSEES